MTQKALLQISAPAPSADESLWLTYLLRRLEHQWLRCVPFDAYFEGDHNLKHLTTKWDEAFGATMGQMVSNWCPLVVEAAAERIEVQGFRFGRRGASGSVEASDDAAWDIWQENCLDGRSDMLHEDAVKLGAMFWLVEPPAVAGDAPLVTIEHPSQVFVLVDPGNPRRRLAAVKRWWQEDGYVRANVYLPDRVAKFVSAEKAKAGLAQRYEVMGAAEPNRLGVVPIVPVLNEPSAIYGGRSALRNVVALQDAMNKILADAMISSEYMAYPQRVLLGADVPKDPETGKPLAGFELVSSQSRLWAFANQDAKVAEFSPADLGNYTRLREHIIADLMAQQRLPSYYVAGGQIVNVSEGALKVLDAGLVKRVRRAHRSMGEAHEEMMRLAFLSMGDSQRGSAMDLATVWANPEIRSESELADAVVKYQAVGVPSEFLWEILGFSPQQIGRMQTMRENDAVLGSLASAAPDVRRDAAQVPSAGQ